MVFSTYHTTWEKLDTRPRALNLNQALKITILPLRHNLTEELLADLFEVSQPTISRVIHRIEDALEQLPELKLAGLESLQNIPGSLVVDGTLIPVKELGFTRANTLFW